MSVPCPNPVSDPEKVRVGPYTPTLILHGGAGSITRAHLPPALYAAYAASLSAYAQSTSDLLRSGASALDAACAAVSRMEDDALFNCGRGAVFTAAGTIELEASVMVTSVRRDHGGPGSVKRGAAVSLLRGTRHPVLLAREVLLQGDPDGEQGLGSMHEHRSGPDVEEWGWGERGLERKGAEWFWTRKRWEEHRRGLEGKHVLEKAGADDDDDDDDGDGMALPSQGTVGAVCMDSWGDLAVATSTGGLTNKKPGRIGDTPTLGAGFWAEAWEERDAEDIVQQRVPPAPDTGPSPGPLDLAADDLGSALAMCLPFFTAASSPSTSSSASSSPSQMTTDEKASPQPHRSPSPLLAPRGKPAPPRTRRRAVALSGTGNGDSFLRTCAAHTAAAMCRFGHASLGQAVTNVAARGGELERSAGARFGTTGEGEGGIIGIEAVSGQTTGRLVARFNCGGMWRAWIDEKSGKARVMVFEEEYT